MCEGVVVGCGVCTCGWCVCGVCLCVCGVFVHTFISVLGLELRVSDMQSNFTTEVCPQPTLNVFK